MNKRELWRRYKRHLCAAQDLGLRVDISRMMFDDEYLDRMSAPMAGALAAMDKLEGGAMANVDENRMVGHYWLRAPELAADPAIADEIRRTVGAIKGFVDQVHNAEITPERGDGFYVVLVIGIGGSALGPQFIADALGTSDDPMILRFIDNTDPDGIDRTLAELDEALGQTLTIVISKSGGTIETRNGMLEVAAAYERAGLNFAKHAVAVTTEGSQLRNKAVGEGWLRIFPVWDWVGGRTSELSAVGLLPAALQGIDVDAMLAGARDCDVLTREHEWRTKNPAALLAAMWYYAATIRHRRNMVILPYRDRLSLLGRYLQQLIMESIGKEVDRAGQVVHQGLTVYGNKGTTDQHSFVQQLREGANDFFVIFIDVQRDREGESIPVEEPVAPSLVGEEAAAWPLVGGNYVTTGDYLSGFLHGTREALYENGRESITITLDALNARTVGTLIGLFERAVGLYAELINVNAYDQPGVEAGKKAAAAIVDLQRRVFAYLRSHPGSMFTADEIADALGRADSMATPPVVTSEGKAPPHAAGEGVAPPHAAREAVASPLAGGDVESIFHILEHAAANPDRRITRQPEADLCTARYGSA